VNQPNIVQLIEEYRRQQGWTKRQFLDQFKYSRSSKAERRWNDLYAGNWKAASGLISKLPSILGITAEQVNAAIAQSDRERDALDHEKLRAEFRPHAIIITVPKHQRPNTERGFALLHGRSRYLTIRLTDIAVDQYVPYVIAQMNDVEQIDMLPRFFDRVVGFRIRYTFDIAATFDIHGNRMLRGTRNSPWGSDRNFNLHQSSGGK